MMNKDSDSGYISKVELIKFPDLNVNCKLTGADEDNPLSLTHGTLEWSAININEEHCNVNRSWGIRYQLWNMFKLRLDIQEEIYLLVYIAI